MSEKICAVCKQVFDGQFKRCETCLQKQRERSKRYKRGATGRATAASYAARPETRDRMRAAARRSYARNLERNRKAKRDLARRLYAADPDKFRTRSKAWAEANPMARRMNEARRRARKAGTKVVEISQAQLAGKAAMYHDRCWICKSAPWTVWDHVKPLSRGGAHILANLRPACGPCNQSKYNTWPL